MVRLARLTPNRADPQLTQPPSAMRACEATALEPDTRHRGPWMLGGAAALGAQESQLPRSPGSPPAGAACPSLPQCPPYPSSSQPVPRMAQPCLSLPAHVYFDLWVGAMPWDRGPQLDPGRAGGLAFLCRSQIGRPCLGHWNSSKAARVISLVRVEGALPTLVPARE